MVWITSWCHTRMSVIRVTICPCGRNTVYSYKSFTRCKRNPESQSRNQTFSIRGRYYSLLQRYILAWKTADLLNTFGDCSGLKLNATKSEANCGLEKMLIERICLLMLSGHKDLSMHWRQLFHVTLISVKQTISPLKHTNCRTFLIYGHNVTYRCMVEYYLQKP